MHLHVHWYPCTYISRRQVDCSEQAVSHCNAWSYCCTACNITSQTLSSGGHLCTTRVCLRSCFRSSFSLFFRSAAVSARAPSCTHGMDPGAHHICLRKGGQGMHMISRNCMQGEGEAKILPWAVTPT